MKGNGISRLLRGIWVVAAVLWLAICIFPVSNLFTRGIGLFLFVLLWTGAIRLVWHRRVLRLAFLGVTLVCGGFLMLPSRSLPATELLRREYVAGLRSYNGVRYYWGGESRIGVDCSGLIRRGLIDSMFCRGLDTFNPGLVRRALVLWWHDTSARALGELHEEVTMHVLDAPSLNQLDHSKVLPGDLAVTRSGVHVMAYLGDREWIEADPLVGRVISATAPTNDNEWFRMPMKIVRWSILSE